MRLKKFDIVKENGEDELFQYLGINSFSIGYGFYSSYELDSLSGFDKPFTNKSLVKATDDDIKLFISKYVKKAFIEHQIKYLEENI